ncbi:FtsX-like permease family protein [Ruminococcaceae bacterium OttesenSCG-928-L11]|nr:FtsX-like permease family protein [Ruminococcaceae bacterium OttesenSCG-928-L11]
MSILARLSARHLHLNRKRTAITILGIALSVAMVTAISGFIVSFQDLLYHDAVNREGLWHVRYSGLDEDTMSRVATEPVFSEHHILEEEGAPVLSLLFDKVDRGLFERSEEVCLRYGIGREQVRYHNNLLIAKGIVPAGYYESLYAFAAILLSLVAIASIMVISNAFSISASERSRQFGLLKSVGATGRQIRAVVQWEGILLGICAIPLGIVVGLLVQGIALAIANSILGTMDSIKFMAEFRVVTAPWVVILAVVAAFFTIFLAAWLPARRAGSQSAIDAIRQTSEIKIRPRDVRISPLTRRLFGFEGTLAAKTMKRNRRRYRTTVISLVVSIVLFVGVSSFGQMLFKASTLVYEDYGSNALVQIDTGTIEEQNRMAAEIASWEGVETFPFRELHGLATIPEHWMTENGLEMLGAGEKKVFLYSLSDDAFEALCRSLRVDPSSLSDPASPGGILINQSGTYIRQGRRHNFTPYRSLTGETLPLTILGKPFSLSIQGESDKIPTAIAMFFSANGMNLVIPEALRQAWSPSDQAEFLNLTVMALDPEGFAEKAEAFLSAGLMNDRYYVANYEAMVANNRNIWALIMIFVYGFIALLSLISITNVITTISTGIALRRREFAVLRSVGMAQRDISRSLRYESLIYGLKSLAFGIPLGIAVSFAMYYALDTSMSFEYIWPTQSILISVVAVVALTFSTMAFSSHRQRTEAIAGILQNEVT